jgi:hypothetical protein
VLALERRVTVERLANSGKLSIVEEESSIEREGDFLTAMLDKLKIKMQNYK